MMHSWLNKLCTRLIQIRFVIECSKHDFFFLNSPSLKLRIQPLGLMVGKVLLVPKMWLEKEWCGALALALQSGLRTDGYLWSLVVPVETKVHTLINLDLGVWKQDLVHQLFLPHEASVILGISLIIRRPLDWIVWAHAPSGMFSTSSAYKRPVSSDSASLATSLNPGPQKQFWKGIWQLHIPNKIKQFICSASNNALPTMSNCFTSWLPLRLPVDLVNLFLKTCCMLSGFAWKWNVLGVHSSAFIKRTFLLQMIFVS